MSLFDDYQAEVDAGTRDAADLGVAEMINRDSASWEQALREGAAARGVTYDPSDLEGVKRQVSYAENAGRDPQDFLNSFYEQYDVRGASGGDREHGGYNTAWDDADPNRFGKVPPSQGASQNYAGLMRQLTSATDPAQQAITYDKLARTVFADLQAAGHDVNWEKDELVIDGRRYTVGGTAAATAYTPGEIGTGDIPDRSVDDWFSMANTPSEVERMADQVVMDILSDPAAGFGDEFSSALKSRAKDQQTDTFLQEQEGLSDAAHLLGQDPLTSPWAQSEKLASRRARDLGLAGINTGIDIDVQNLRSTKEREAAGIGTAYAGQKAQQRQNALALASDNVFRQAALTGDRLALRESVAQRAAELGIQTDALMSDYIVSKQRELTTRIGMRLGYDIDVQKLEQSDSQFKEEMMLKLTQLEEASRQFEAQYGLDLADLEFRMDNEAWDRYVS